MELNQQRKLPSGKLTKSYGKWAYNSYTIYKWSIVHSYVKWPEATVFLNIFRPGCSWFTSHIWQKLHDLWNSISQDVQCAAVHSYVHKFGQIDRLRIAFLPIPEYLLHFSASWTAWGWIRGNSEVEIASRMAKSPILVQWIPQHMGPLMGPQNDQIHK